jgi:hypothetical protein
VIRGDLSSVVAKIGASLPRGEFVVIF